MRNSFIMMAVVSLLGAYAAVPAKAAEYVYVESNIQSPNGNSIFAFIRGADGSLSQISGSPFPAGGAGVQDESFALGPYDSDQNLIVDPICRRLYAVNSGSDSIAVFNINSNGSLTAIQGSPFPSGGTNPVSVGLDGNKLYVVNKNGDFARITGLEPNYTVLQIASDGSLSPLPASGSTVDVAFLSSPSQALVVPKYHLLFGADLLGGLLQSFQIEPSGGLRQNLPIPLPPNTFIPPVDYDVTHFQIGAYPLGLYTHPFQRLLYVGYLITSQVGVYSFDYTGKLTFLRAVPNSGRAICWIRVNREGTRLYTGNNGVVGDPVLDKYSTVSAYDLTDASTPVELQTLQISGLGNVTQIELSGDEKHLYVVSQRATPEIPAGEGNALHNFTVLQDGTLSETYAPIPLPVPVGTQPQGVAVFDDWGFGGQ